MNILIGSSGTNAGFNFALSIRRSFSEITVISMDINPAWLVPASLYSDLHVVSPYADAPNFLEFLENLISQNDIDLFIPINSKEIEVAHKHFRGKSLLMTPECSWLDKRRCNEVLSNNQIPVPKSITLSDSLSGEFFVKPIDGNGSIGARNISASEVSSVDVTRNLLQEKCNGPEITVDSLCFGEELIIRCRERVEVKSGVCTKARVFWDQELYGLAKKIAKVTGQSGLICFQVMRSIAGEWVVTDLNLRPGGGTAMSCVYGGDLYSALLAKYVDREAKIRLDQEVNEHFVCRQFSEFVTSAPCP